MCAKDCNETDSRSPRNAAGSTFILTRRAQRGGRRRETGDPALPLVTPVSAPPVPRSPGPGRVCRTGEAGKWVRTGRGGRGGRRGLTCRRTAGAPSPPPVGRRGGPHRLAVSTQPGWMMRAFHSRDCQGQIISNCLRFPSAVIASHSSCSRAETASLRKKVPEARPHGAPASQTSRTLSPPGFSHRTRRRAQP